MTYQQEALLLAKKSILEHWWDDFLSTYTLKNPELMEKKSCFVTLKSFWTKLRWCIGSLTSTNDLYIDIIHNAKAAAFQDTRFDSLEYDDIKDLKLFIEITILSPMEEKKFYNMKEVLNYLEKNKPWLVIKLDNHQATFLPSVWNELSSAEEFLTHLIYKTWLHPNMFSKRFQDVEFFIYTGEEFGKSWEDIKL